MSLDPVATIPVISGIDSGGLLARSKRAELGDVIVAINGERLQGSVSSAVGAISRASWPRILTLQRRARLVSRRNEESTANPAPALAFEASASGAHEAFLNISAPVVIGGPIVAKTALFGRAVSCTEEEMELRAAKVRHLAHAACGYGEGNLHRPRLTCTMMPATSRRTQCCARHWAPTRSPQGPSS